MTESNFEGSAKAIAKEKSGPNLGISAKGLDLDNFGDQWFDCVSPSAAAAVTPSDDVWQPKQWFVPGVHVAVMGELIFHASSNFSKNLAIRPSATDVI